MGREELKRLARKEGESPKASFAAGVIKRSANRVWLIQTSTVLRKENTITLTPTVIATAMASAATVTEFRREAPGEDCRPPVLFPSGRARVRDNGGSNFPPLLLKRNISRGTRKENPATTQNAATKLSQRDRWKGRATKKCAAEMKRDPGKEPAKGGQRRAFDSGPAVEGLRPVSAWRPAGREPGRKNNGGDSGPPRQANIHAGNAEIAHTPPGHRADEIVAETALVKTRANASHQANRGALRCRRARLLGENSIRTSPRVAPNERRMPISCCRRTTDAETVL